MSISGFWEHPGAVGVWDVWIRATPLGIPPHTPGPALKGTKVTPRTPLGRTCHFVPKLVPQTSITLTSVAPGSAPGPVATVGTGRHHGPYLPEVDRTGMGADRPVLR